jgi:signal transduction histidine kinase
VDRSIISTIGVLAGMGGLALIIQRNRNMIERERLRALTEKNRELQELHTSLQKANQDLGTRLVERETLIHELEAKNAELERFTYTVSHDLKAPLFTINGFLGYLESDAASGNLERFAADRQRIQEAVGRMKSLLDSLLEISRLGRLMNPSERIEFSALTLEAVENMRSQLDAGRVKVTVQPGLPAVFGDRERLLEVLQNLIDNAVKFMDTQAEPRIEIGQNGDEDGRPVLFVQDNGIGIAPEFHERIFGLFNKLDPRSDGTGVGLALVKRIVEIHGGRIWVESQAGKGTTFYFSLPGAARSS